MIVLISFENRYTFNRTLFNSFNLIAIHLIEHSSTVSTLSEVLNRPLQKLDFSLGSIRILGTFSEMSNNLKFV